MFGLANPSSSWIWNRAISIAGGPSRLTDVQLLLGTTAEAFLLANYLPKPPKKWNEKIKAVVSANQRRRDTKRKTMTGPFPPTTLLLETSCSCARPTTTRLCASWGVISISVHRNELADFCPYHHSHHQFNFLCSIKDGMARGLRRVATNPPKQINPSSYLLSPPFAGNHSGQRIACSRALYRHTKIPKSSP